jgi:hypothetical protein
MSLAYIRRRYDLPWIRNGLRVKVDGRPGAIMRGRSR